MALALGQIPGTAPLAKNRMIWLKPGCSFGVQKPWPAKLLLSVRKASEIPFWTAVKATKGAGIGTFPVFPYSM